MRVRGTWGQGDDEQHMSHARQQRFASLVPLLDRAACRLHRDRQPAEKGAAPGLGDSLDAASPLGSAQIAKSADLTGGGPCLYVD